MVRLQSKITFNRVCLVMTLCAGASAALILAWPAGSDPYAAAPPIDLVDSRSPAGRAPAALVDLRFPSSNAAAQPAPAAPRVADEIDETWRALLNPHPTYAPAPARTTLATAVATPVAPRPAVKHEAAATRSVTRTAAVRPRPVLNDAQIAHIKQRLNLTPDQEKIWPSVEAALRNLAFAKKQPGQSGGAVEALAKIDPAGPDVEQLKSAATPLVMSFSAEQQRELRTLASIAGLDKLVP
jgi:hypothetical protein